MRDPTVQVLKCAELLGYFVSADVWCVILLCMSVQVLKCAELLGYFVSADVWCKMILENVKSSQSSAALSVLAAVIRGSEPSQLAPHLGSISAVITDPAICHVAEVCILDIQYSQVYTINK